MYYMSELKEMTKSTISDLTAVNIELFIALLLSLGNNSGIFISYCLLGVQSLQYFFLGESQACFTTNGVTTRLRLFVFR